MQTRERVDLMVQERIVVAGLVEGFLADPEARLDRELLADHRAAETDGERLRVVVDQVASLTDARALALHQAWRG